LYERVLLPSTCTVQAHKNFAWMVHIDGLEARHDESVSKDGVQQQSRRSLAKKPVCGHTTHLFD